MQVNAGFFNILRTTIYKSFVKGHSSSQERQHRQLKEHTMEHEGGNQIDERSTGHMSRTEDVNVKVSVPGELHCSCAYQQSQSKAANMLQTLKSHFPHVCIVVFKINFHNCIVQKGVCFKIAFKFEKGPFQLKSC